MAGEPITWIFSRTPAATGAVPQPAAAPAGAASLVDMFKDPNEAAPAAAAAPADVPPARTGIGYQPPVHTPAPAAAAGDTGHGLGGYLTGVFPTRRRGNNTGGGTAYGGQGERAAAPPLPLYIGASRSVRALLIQAPARPLPRPLSGPYQAPIRATVQAPVQPSPHPMLLPTCLPHHSPGSNSAGSSRSDTSRLGSFVYLVEVGH